MRVAECGRTPLPLRVMAAGELLASLTTEILPLAPPVLTGANTTLKAALVPTGKGSGRESPLMLKPVPVTLA